MQRTGARLLGLLGVVAGCALAAPAASAALLISTRIDPHERGRAIPHSFLGFSAEWKGLFNVTGNAGTGPNPIYQQLLASLSQPGGGTPTLRIGGNYQDDAWWNPMGLPPPYKRGIFVNIKPSLLQGVAENARMTGQRMILGVNLAVYDTKIAKDEARAFLDYIPRRNIIGMEIGNEPDFYDIRLIYEQRDKDGRVVARHYARSPRFNGRDYVRQWEHIAAALRHVDHRIPLIGTAGYGQIIGAARFVARERRRLAVYTEHAYPLVGCNTHGVAYTPRSKHYPTLAKLLGREGAYTTVRQERLGVRAAHRFHKRYVIDEMNSVSCTTRIGVSNSFGTTLWALDQLFLQVALGVDGIDFSVGNSLKSPFSFTLVGPQKFVGKVSPLYYAMLPFARAAGPHGRLLLYPTYSARPGAHGRANARVWAVRDGKHLRIVVVNKDLKRSGTVRIAVPRGRRAGTLTRLSAPRASSTSGVSFGGQTIPNPTFDGLLQGNPVARSVRPARGVYAFAMPRASAALLTIG